MVEQEAVNFEVAGSSPVPGAMNKKECLEGIIFYSLLLETRQRTEGSDAVEGE